MAVGAIRGWSVGIIKGRLKKEDLLAARSPVRTVLLRLTRRGQERLGMKEIRGGSLGLLVFFKRKGEDGRVRRRRSGNRWGELERLVLFGQKARKSGRRWSCRGEGEPTVATVGAAEGRAAILAVFGAAAILQRRRKSHGCKMVAAAAATAVAAAGGLGDRGEEFCRGERDDAITVCDVLVAA
uniref:Uncharacterized protein n=1 Tax=Populus alba TaxID=43335 RepID=A0A4U5P6J1_POPAL|nr:hypothetical protein D5086_0000222650 [Populus alba]